MILHVESFRYIIPRPARSGGKAHDIDRLRAGGKVRRFSKRGKFLERVLYDGPHDFEALAEFGNRANVRNYLAILHRIHGIGYQIENGEISVQLPPPYNESPELIFK